MMCMQKVIGGLTVLLLGAHLSWGGVTGPWPAGVKQMVRPVSFKAGDSLKMGTTVKLDYQIDGGAALKDGKVQFSAFILKGGTMVGYCLINGVSNPWTILPEGFAAPGRVNVALNVKLISKDRFGRNIAPGSYTLQIIPALYYKKIITWGPPIGPQETSVLAMYTSTGAQVINLPINLVK